MVRRSELWPRRFLTSTSCLTVLGESCLNWYRNCSLTVKTFTEQLSSIDNGPTDVVLLDLEKAFELAKQLAILSSLIRKGATGRLLSRITECLIDGQTTVRFKGVKLDFKALENDTPHRGILILSV